ncbi:MAG: NAD(P)/FAD-dependent oxidoreductase, partial [Actinomycetota bacterium]|nr:NAD(P)/FAD-dependent oxidoreductase [Actinomycetota bacterium]
MSETADIVVAGAGHNSLVTAAYLARAGFDCVVLEARPVIGGNTATEELTLPGFLHDSCSTAHNLIQANPAVRELGLEEYGLDYIHPDPVVHIPFPDGAWLTQWRSLERTSEEFAKFSRRDAEAYRRLIADYDAAKGVFGAYRNNPIGRAARPEDALDGRWRRRLAMSAWDVIRGEFEDWHTRAFMLWMSVMTVQPPDRPGTGLLAYSLAYGRQQHSWTIPRGGSAALPIALARLIEDHGGTVVAGRRVAGLVLEGDRCVGVETAEGETYRARRAVVSTIHVKHLVEMAPRELWDDEFLYGVEAWRPGLALFPTHLATTEAPAYPVDGGEIVPVASGTAPSVERLLRMGNDAERGAVADDDPVLL